MTSIDWASFSPWAALSGGALIGAAAALLILANGRVAGITGILAGVVQPAGAIEGWRLWFLAGLLLAPVLAWAVGASPSAEPQASPALLLLSGLLVGVGTRLGGGCTSGHGVCGLARLSPRSLVATLTFLSTGVLVAVVTRHVL